MEQYLKKNQKKETDVTGNWFRVRSQVMQNTVLLRFSKDAADQLFKYVTVAS